MSNQIKVQVDEIPVNVREDVIYEINQSNPNSYTHNFFKYPCKFIPEIPRWGIKSLYNGTGLILDPFSGSGTTLLEASLKGYSSMGCEIDDVAKLITKVKSTPLSGEELSEIKRITNIIVASIESKSYLKDEIVLPKIDNLEHWFKDDILSDLGYLYHSIKQQSNENIKNFLLICMASIIKRVSNADDISPKPYVSNKIIKNPPDVAPTFFDTVVKYITAIEKISSLKMGEVKIQGDATHILCDENSVGLAITSPPYINAFDYVRTLRLENLWLEMATEEELRKKKKLYLGTESITTKKEKVNTLILNDSNLLNEYYRKIYQSDERRALILKKFFEDMKSNLLEVHRALMPDSCYVIVIGNSTIRNVDVESWKVLKDIAEKIGYKYVTHFGYEIKNPYIRIPRGKKGGKISVDHILVVKK